VPEGEPKLTLADLDSAPTELDASRASVSKADYEALNGKFTIVSNENFSLKQEIEVLTKRVRTSEILDSLIKPYAGRAFWFMVGYCAFVGLVIIATGVRWTSQPLFSQPERVLEIMVGSTAVTVIGLVGMVLTGIFVGARKSGG